MALRQLKRLIPDQHPLRLLWHKSKALAAAARYGFPARKLTVIGITGTDGKTTTVGMAAHILHENGIAYNVFGDQNKSRPWELDALPVLIPAAQWRVISSGLRIMAKGTRSASKRFTAGGSPAAYR